MADHQEPYVLPPEDPALAELDKQVSKDRNASRWMKWALLGVALIACGLAVLSYVYFNQAKDNAEALAVQQAQEKQVIAEEARAVICTAADVEVYDEELCSRLEAAADTGAAIAGRDGKDGRDGATGPRGVPGQDGRDGVDGRDGTDGSDGLGLPGLNGQDGVSVVGPTGPAGPTGPPGKDGAPGVPGSPGAVGPSGRGMVGGDCVGTGEASYWMFEYSDGTSQMVSGPCRINLSAPNPEPLPTTSIRP